MADITQEQVEVVCKLLNDGTFRITQNYDNSYFIDCSGVDDFFCSTECPIEYHCISNKTQIMKEIIDNKLLSYLFI